MQDKVTFEYAIIRVVPKVEREEFLNVGAIVFSKPKKFLGMKYLINEARLKAFSKELEVADLTKYLEAWEAVCAGSSEGGAIGQLDLADRFRWLTAARSTIIQSAQPHPGLCADPEKELEWLFKTFVL
jgi:hypothetical protein